MPGNASLGNDEHIEQDQQQAEEGHGNECRAPAKVAGQHASGRHAQHRTEHARGSECAGQGGAHGRGKDAQDDSQPHATVTGLPQPHEKTRGQHMAIVLREPAPQGGQAPEQHHQHHTSDATHAVCQDGDRDSQQPHHQADNAAEQTELGIAQAPFGFQLGKHGAEHLPRHVVRQHQAEDDGKYQPRVDARAGSLERQACVGKRSDRFFLHGVPSWSIATQGVVPIQ
ncbi:hypothetical protein D3C85_1119790 [compost metagenome]